MASMMPVVTSSVPMMVILLSCGCVAANSRWNTYSRPSGPTTCGFMEHSAAADSLKCGYAWKKADRSRGASSRGTPLISRGIVKEVWKGEEENIELGDEMAQSRHWKDMFNDD